MTRMSDYEERDWAAGRAYLAMGCWQGSYRQGVYRHPLGLVEVYEQVGSRPMTSLRFRHRGRDYTRTWRTVWGDKTLARLARELIDGC